jgi:hypothetical protein
LSFRQNSAVRKLVQELAGTDKVELQKRPGVEALPRQGTHELWTAKTLDRYNVRVIFEMSDAALTIVSVFSKRTVLDEAPKLVKKNTERRGS